MFWGWLGFLGMGLVRDGDGGWGMVDGGGRGWRERDGYE